MEDNINLSVASNTLELKLEMATHMITHTDHVARLHLTHKEWSFTPADDPELSELGFGCMVQTFLASSDFCGYPACRIYQQTNHFLHDARRKICHVKTDNELMPY